MNKILKDVFNFFVDIYEAAIFVLWDLPELFRKYVETVPSVTVSVSPASLDIGQSLTITGVVNSDVNISAPSSTPVNILITDAAGNAQPAIAATTGTNGAYTATFVIPTGFASGTATVAVTSLGVTATATFRRK